MDDDVDKYNGPMSMEGMTQKEGSRFIFCAASDRHLHWLGNALDSWAVAYQELIQLDVLVAQIDRARPQIVLLDFSGHSPVSDMVALAQTLKIRQPAVHQVAVGSCTCAEGAVAAMRAGIHHFISMEAEEAEARELIRTMVAGLPANNGAHCTVISLIGARTGIGTTTLAVHLADILQQQESIQQTRQRVALLDLGWPIGDGQLYMNINATFDLLDAVRNRHRLDQTLVQTAISHSASGVRVLSLPRIPENLHVLTATDVLGLITQLQSYFDVILVDLGGITDTDMSMRIANASDQVWLLTDQSVGSLVSLDALIKTMDRNQIVRSKRHLVVNRHDESFGMSALQIAERFKIPLKATIPESRQKLVSSANAGKLLHEMVRSSPYTNAITALAVSLMNTNEERRHKEGLSRWLQRLFPGRDKQREQA